jgi:calcineurin-like phosphoesterase family protein
VINLCGHTHTTDRWSDFDKGLIYHVDVDAHDMKPTLLDDIIEEIKEKVNE